MQNKVLGDILAGNYHYTYNIDSGSRDYNTISTNPGSRDYNTISTNPGYCCSTAATVKPGTFTTVINKVESNYEILEKRIDNLEEENNILRDEASYLYKTIDELKSQVEEMRKILYKDAQVLKLSEDDEKFKGILGDLLEEGD